MSGRYKRVTFSFKNGILKGKGLELGAELPRVKHILEYVPRGLIQLALSLQSACQISNIRHLHICHSALYLPSKILHKLCFSFLLGITAVPREIENNAYAKFWGANKVGDMQVTYGDINYR